MISKSNTVSHIFDKSGERVEVTHDSKADVRKTLETMIKEGYSPDDYEFQQVEQDLYK